MRKREKPETITAHALNANKQWKCEQRQKKRQIFFLMKTINRFITFETDGTKYEDPHIITKQSIEMIVVAS